MRVQMVCMATGWKSLPCYMFEISTRMVNQGENCVGSKAQRKGRWIVTLQTNCIPTCTTDEEVIYSRDVGGHNIMKIFKERVYYQKNRKDVEETHEAQKISCLLQKAQKGLGMVRVDYNKAYDNGTSLVDNWMSQEHVWFCRKPDGGNPKQSETIHPSIQSHNKFKAFVVSI